MRRPAFRLAPIAASALFAGLMFAGAPAPALASTADDWANVIETTLTSPDYQPFSSTDGAAALSDDGAATTAVTGRYGTTSASKFDLRDYGVVTPVKRQHPWGTCWGFSAIAACETSLLSQMDTTYSETPIDLSEKQLVAATFRDGGAPESVVGEAQAGEGFHNAASDPNLGFNRGGFTNYASSLFAAGIGPLKESIVPYKNTEGIKECRVYLKGNRSGDSEIRYLTDDEIAALRLDTANIEKVVEKNWAGNYTDASGNAVYPDWSTLSEDLWSSSSYEFDSSNVLPDIAKHNAQYEYLGTQTEGIEAVKAELVAGRAVSIAFHADSYSPYITSAPKYISTQTWAHYTYDNAYANHAVTIVGWDDDYDAKNFAEGFDVSEREKHTPEGNGAWIVKNSWGATANDFPNGDVDKEFGVLDEDGNHTGYFYLSYYDHSVCQLETFEFDLTEYSDNEEFDIDQYDYMASTEIFSYGSSSKGSTANVYTADDDMAIRALSCMTAKPNTTVDYEVYLLDDEATTPNDPQHSTLIYQITSETYAYGGYHRLKLAEDNWIAVRAGQRYAVVTTQRAEGKYYITANTNWGVLKGDIEKEYREYYTTTELASVKNSYYSKYYDQAYAENREKGMSQAEAATAAKATAEAEVAKADVAAQIEREAAENVEGKMNSYFVVKVNPGESFTNIEVDESIGTSAQDADGDARSADEGSDAQDAGEWTDWSEVSAKVLAKSSRAVDNLPIKAYGELRDWASVDELTSLDEAVAKAKELLAGVTVSADGSDVAADAQWMTQADHDALAAVIEEAEQVMEGAGTFYKTALANTTPSSDEVNEQVDNLSTFEAQVAAALKPGTYVAPQPSGEKGDGGAGAGEASGAGEAATATPAAKKAYKSTPSTGDATGAAVAGALALSGVVSLGAFVVKRGCEE